MKGQSRKRLAQIMEQFPATSVVRSRRKRQKDGEWVFPTTKISVQQPDAEVMHLQATNLHYNGRGYAMPESSDLRGTRVHYLQAIDAREQVIGELDWDEYPSIESLELMVRDIFDNVDPDQVAYLLWIGIYTWYPPASEARELETGLLFDEHPVGMELNIIVYPKPKDTSWGQLVKEADRLKKERDEAYLHPPKETPDLPGIHQALREGFRLHAFLSGGGLRVVSLSKEGEECGYGEHPNVEEALNHLDEDFLAGGRSYKEVYGVKYPHYLTGATLPTSNIDHWVRRGYTFDVWQEGGEVVLQLKGYSQVEMPDWVKERIDADPTQPVRWGSRGFTYEGRRSRLPNAEPSYNWETVSRPDDKRGEHLYQVTKTGRGTDLWSAMTAAFESEEEEIAA